MLNAEAAQYEPIGVEVGNKIRDRKFVSKTDCCDDIVINDIVSVYEKDIKLCVYSAYGWTGTCMAVMSHLPILIHK